MPQSPSVSKLVEALAKAQSEFESIKKNRIGQEGNQRFPYSTLSQVLEAVKPPLNKQGIFLSQPVIVDDKGNQRVTTKVQLGDEFIATDGVLLTPGLVGGKAFGRESTYARRYDLNAFMSVCAEDDDEDAHDLKPGTPTPGAKPSFPKQINTPKAAEKAVAKAVSEKPTSPTDFPFGKNAENSSVVGGAAPGGNPEITDDDLPPEIFGDPQPTTVVPLSVDLEETAQAIDAPDTLSKERYDFIQERLKEIATKKLSGVTTKSLSSFLGARHKGKKLVYVPAVTAENTLKLVEEAVEGGPAKIKELFNSVKENK